MANNKKGAIYRRYKRSLRKTLERSERASVRSYALGMLDAKFDKKWPWKGRGHIIDRMRNAFYRPKP
jgi:hypothetical protein